MDQTWRFRRREPSNGRYGGAEGGNPVISGSREHLEQCLARIQRHDATLRGMITTMAASARAEADAADAAALRGDWLGPLHGVTVSLKDVIDTAGVRTTAGAQFFTEHVPTRDAEIVTRLKRAGAVIVGKVNLHEFAYGGTTQNPFFGSCRNPWDPERIPGGSSGGSGAATAAEYATISLGTDTAGSGRVPAALNGLACLRPTTGRISNRGVFPCSPAYDTISPMAYRVADVARAYGALAGYDAEDPVSVDAPVDDPLGPLHAPLAGMRIGLPRRYFFEDVDGDILAGTKAAAFVLEKLGARLVECDIPGAEDAKDYFEKIFHPDAAHVHRERLRNDPGKFGRDTLERLNQMGLGPSAADYAASLRRQEWFTRQLQEVFAGVDAVFSPGCGTVAPRIADSAQTTTTTRRLTRFCYVWSFAKLPVLAVPCGLTGAGMPFGFAIAGPPWQEARLLRIGAAFQRATDWHTRRPALLST
ncbi:MAG: amidase [Alphaproteobacteria bacterium]|nr:amidase [Alphaproteobacteria bacterium]